MKVIFIKKRFLYFISFTILFCIIIFYYHFYIKNSNVTTFNPVDDNTHIDLNYDGINDIISILDDDISIKIGNSKYLLSNYYSNNSLTSYPSSWPSKLFIYNLSRSLSPELIVQSNNNKVSTISIFQYKDKKLNKIYTADKNIFGILNADSTKTPICYSFNSSDANTTINSFMISNSEIIDTTKYDHDIPGLKNILTFIDLIQKDYELDETPDIFIQDIPFKELSLLWNLNKENFTYSFQDGFFKEDFIDSDGNITSLSWRLTFEKYSKGDDDSSKKQIIFYVSSELSDDSTFKISSINIS